MILSDLIYIFSIWLVTLIVGVISWPVTQKLFHRLSDKGYTISKLLGFFVISYAVFVLATMKVIMLSLPAIVAVVAGWGGFNFWLWNKQRDAFKASVNWRSILSVEALFLLLLVFWAFLRSHEPEIYSIERYMDFGFIQALFNTDTLPLFDMWFLGEPLNYYYFGHFIGYVALSLSKVPALPGFFVLACWVFAMVGVNVYRLSADLFRQFRISRRSARFQRWVRFATGWTGIMLVQFIGAWHTTLWLIDRIRQMFDPEVVTNFFWAVPSRIIPGTITEPPIYSFLVAEGHAHVWAFFNGIFVLTLLYMMLIQPARCVRPVLKSYYFWALCLMLGIAFMTNSYDVLSLGGLTGFVMLLKYRHNVKQLLLGYLILPLAAYGVALPWSVFISVPLQGMGIVPEPSPLLEWFYYWGAWVLLIMMFAIGVNWQRGGAIKRFWNRPRLSFHWIVIGLSAFILLMLEIVYMKDILLQGEWYRANTVFKFTSQVWLWLGTIGASIVTWLVLFPRKWWAKTLNIALLVLIFIGPAFYTPIAIEQGALGHRQLTGLGSGLGWWESRLSYDYEAYEYLRGVREQLPQGDKMRRILEAEGDSYSDANRFATFLGWPTVIGWAVHEWTWRGSYDEIAIRRNEVYQFYIGEDEAFAKDFLKKYVIDYVVVGEHEYARYGEDIKLDRILTMGEVVFANDKTLILKTR